MTEAGLVDFKNELTEFIELEKSLMPRREAIEEILEQTRGVIIEKAREDSSLTASRLEDLSIIEAGLYYQQYYDKLLTIRRKLENAKGQFVLIQDTSYQLFLDPEQAGHKHHEPFPTAAIGKIGDNPFQVGFEEATDGSHFYLKLMFENGEYIRECRVKDSKPAGMFSKFERLIPSQQGTGVYRKKVKELRYVLSDADFERSYENILNHYLNRPGGQKSKKPYWKIAAGKFKSHHIVIDRRPAVKVPDYHGNIEFAMYIGNREVSRRLGMDVSGIGSLNFLHEILLASRTNGSKKSLIVSS